MFDQIVAQFSLPVNLQLICSGMAQKFGDWLRPASRTALLAPDRQIRRMGGGIWQSHRSRVQPSSELYPLLEPVRFQSALFSDWPCLIK